MIDAANKATARGLPSIHSQPDPQGTFERALRVMVEAAMPLEVLIMSGWLKHLTPDTQQAVIKGAQEVRAFLKDVGV